MVDYFVIAKRLLAEQVAEWPLAMTNYRDLEKALVRSFDFDGFPINVQFNPARIVSSSARVDQVSIEGRDCFLCEATCPVEQRAVEWHNYLIRVNPYPIFPEHFTVSDKAHVPQRIGARFNDMLRLAKDLRGMVILYNGPQSGASAPDHFHFQACSKGIVPVETGLETLKSKFGTRFVFENLKVWAVDDGLRKFMVAESADPRSLEVWFDETCHQMQLLSDCGADEPMINLMASFDRKKWQICLFPRSKHRPCQYFEKGEGKILFSPGTVDLCGMLVLPLENDFMKINKSDITDMFRQVLWPEETFNKLIEDLQRKCVSSFRA